jgi:hypothetical protein
LFGCTIDHTDSNWENKVVGNIMPAWIGVLDLIMAAPTAADYEF